MATNYERARDLLDRRTAARLSHKEQALQNRGYAEQAQAYAILALADQLAELTALVRERLPERTEITMQPLEVHGPRAGDTEAEVDARVANYVELINSARATAAPEHEHNPACLNNPMCQCGCDDGVPGTRCNQCGISSKGA